MIHWCRKFGNSVGRTYTPNRSYFSGSYWHLGFSEITFDYYYRLQTKFGAMSCFYSCLSVHRGVGLSAFRGEGGLPTEGKGSASRCWVYLQKGVGSASRGGGGLPTEGKGSASRCWVYLQKGVGSASGGWGSAYRRELGRPPPPGTRTSGSTQPTSMLPCFILISIFKR